MSGPVSMPNLLYVNIPKNASSLTKGKLLEMGWNEDNFLSRDMENTTVLVTLRDPIKRWMSGIAEWMQFYPQLKLDEYFWQRVSTQVIMDDHTVPQCGFLEGITISSMVAFWLDHNYRDKFSEYLRDTLDIENTFNYSSYQNVSNESVFKTNVINFLTERIKDPSVLSHIQHIYKQDYDLISTCNFYKSQHVG